VKSGLILFLTGLSVIGCGNKAARVQCSTNAQCTTPTQAGICEMDQHACAVPNPTCPSGYAYSSTAPVAVASQCVPDTSPDMSVGSDMLAADLLPKPACTTDTDCVNGGTAPCGGTCSSAGQCLYAGNSIDCGTVCAAGSVTKKSCDGAGSCSTAAPRVCDPYTCNAGGTDCESTCTTGGTQCNPPNVCTGTSCGPAALGAKCTAATDCASGNCVDGVCCSSSSCSTCLACNVNGAGTCAPAVAGTPDTHCANQQATCGTTGLCNGTGACATYANGAICSSFGPCTNMNITGGGSQQQGVVGTCSNGTCSIPQLNCNGYGCYEASGSSTWVCDTSCICAAPPTDGTGGCAPGYECTGCKFPESSGWPGVCTKTP
jgi:hypothetical protein